ncbi:hypothetical protein [Streptomyces katsurahamanus]|uniref:Cellulase n=1 Tax=Streptomyces katsurahamanus TaxID=2577098 RepID=A0ABW9NP90_9ACTN|nr:hypothetical protein [Streptomyces katsurahamanus]MQS35136.1 hypothetical protein [Streptomyces katsurahamanus]
MSDHDDRVAAQLRSAADQAGEWTRPVGVRALAARAGERRRRRALAVTGAGVLCAVASVVAVVFTGADPGPESPLPPASITSELPPTRQPAPTPSPTLPPQPPTPLETSLPPASTLIGTPAAPGR